MSEQGMSDQQKAKIYIERLYKVLDEYKRSTDIEYKNRCFYSLVELQKYICQYSDNPEDKEILYKELSIAPPPPTPTQLIGALPNTYINDYELAYLFVPLFVLGRGTILIAKFF